VLRHSQIRYGLTKLQIAEHLYADKDFIAPLEHFFQSLRGAVFVLIGWTTIRLATI
jgi:hypothetical protein